MATVVDALVVTLGLDPKQFTKGQKEAAASLLKTRQAAQREGAAIEKSMDKAGQSLDRLARNALKLFAIFTAGRAVKDFVRDITDSDAALGRLAKTLETTPEALSALGGAVSRSGGSAGAAAGSFKKLADAYNEVKLTGNSAVYDMLMRFQGATGKVIRFGRDTQQTLYDVADAAKAMADKSGVSFTTHLLEQIGIDPGTIALIIQGSAKMKEAQDKVRRLGGVVSKQDTENAQRFQTALKDIGTISEGLGRTIWTNLSPAISEIIERVIKWYEANQQWIKTEIVDRVKAFGDYLRALPWEDVGTGILNFIKRADEAAKAVGGWKVVVETFFALWVGSKFARVLANIGLMRASLLSLAATPGGLAVALAIAGAGAAAATADQMPKVLAKEGAAGVDPATGGAMEAPGASYGNEGWLRPYLKRGLNRVKRFFGGGDASAGGVGVGKGATTAEGKENVASWLEFFQRPSAQGGMGLPRGKAEAMVAMMQGESGPNLNPRSFNPNDNGGPSGGTAQWHDRFGRRERFSALKAFADKAGKPWTDRGVQQQFWKHEAETSHRKVFERIKGASSDEQALYEGVAGFEVPQDVSGQTYRRLGNLNRLRRDREKTGGAPLGSAARRPEVLADPKDERRKPAREPSAWNGIPNAAEFARDAANSQRILASSVANNYSRSEDRRSYSDTKIGSVNVYPATGTQSSIMAELRSAATGNKSFAAQSDYGKA